MTLHALFKAASVFDLAPKTTVWVVFRIYMSYL
jgi:hypothetical protein